jgi:aspartyl-tRNA(Asn)/glutamyl-tRNA(Gln) amidotransferase subunit A
VTQALCDRSAADLSAMLAAAETSAGEILASSQARIEAVDDRVHAFLTPTSQLASERAEELDAYLSTGAPQSAVAGIPVALKDVLTTNGVRTTCGSKILESYVPPYDATAWTRLAGAGAVLVGKTNCDEFAMGSSNENSAFGPVHNPWRRGRRCGPSAPTRGEAFGSPRRCAAWSGSSRPTGASAGTG